jgi:hypothetical protein
MPRHPLVANPPAHPKTTARRRERFLAGLDRHHKPHPLLHRTDLHPSHRPVLPADIDLLPMSPVRFVTHVAGLDPPRHLSRGERPPTPAGARSAAVGG